MSIHESLRTFDRMPLGLKFIFFGAVFAGIFSFLPWFQIDELTTIDGNRLQRDPVMSSGFGFFPVFGMLSMAFAIVTLFVFLRNETGGKHTFGFSNPKVWMCVSGEAMFVLCIAFAVFASQMRIDSTAQLKFGIFLTLIAHAFVFFGAYILEKNTQKQEAKNAFSPFFENQYHPQDSTVPHPHISSEMPSPPGEQLSFSDTAYERKQSILRR